MGLRKLGRYDIVRVLGKGAMGTVYEARDPNLERRVAIKTIAVDSSIQTSGFDYEARFRTEARSAARLQHPNIVSVYDSDRHDDIAYIVMEFVEGEDIKQHFSRGIAFTLAQTQGIMRDLLSALGYAHAQNVVHRDVKPANLMMQTDGRVKLTDFGVARMQDAMDATRTRGVMVGTLKYMSPEQVKGLLVDSRSDLFSAGIVLYQLLTARQPFGGESEFAIIGQIVGSNPPAPSTINPALPASLDAVVARALAKSREQRYATAQEFSRALTQACSEAQDPAVTPPGAGERGAVGMTSGASRSRPLPAFGSVTEASTMSQEIELVYWKDVRDSDDPLDLQGFLDRFPEGIYADLARRRLRKLGVVFMGEQTRTRVETRRHDGPAARAQGTATVATGSEKTVLLPPRADRPDMEPPQAGADATDTASDTATAAPVYAPPARADGTLPAHKAARPHPGAKRPRPRRGIIFAGVAVLVVVMAAAVWWTPDGVPQSEPDRNVTVQDEMLKEQGAGKTAGSVPLPASLPTPAPTPVAAPSSLAADTAANAPVPTPNPGAAKDSTALSRSATAPDAGKAPAALSSAQPVATQATGKPQADPVQSNVLSSPTRAAIVVNGLNPETACADRILLSFQICLNEQCAKPSFASHPVCKQRRAAEQARREQQGTRN